MDVHGYVTLTNMVIYNHISRSNSSLQAVCTEYAIYILSSDRVKFFVIATESADGDINLV